MSQIPAFVGPVLGAMREAREEPRIKKLQGEKRKHVRELMEELRREGVRVNDEAFDLLLKCVTDAPNPADNLDLLCPEPVADVGVVDLREVWTAIAEKNCEPAPLSDIALSLRKFRDKVKVIDPAGALFGGGRADQLCFIVLKYKGEPWLVTLGQVLGGQYLLGAEPLKRSLAAGSMFPFRPK
ncbi:hypothetical protein KW782_04420 [Candidatus Parcubacteria bacterium]|nr:hypothetical protein [Candidatus Parcubacteria bacterium]